MTFTIRRQAGRVRVAAAALCAFAAAGCGDTPASRPPSSANVWAVVDGREITRDQVELAYRRGAPQNATPGDDDLLAAKLSLVDQMIDQEVLIARAQALKIEVTDADLDKAFTERRANLSDEAFQKELTQRSVTVDDMRQALRRELLVDKLIEQEVASRIAVSDDDVRAYFEKNREQFNVAETQHRIAQIVITPVKEPQIRNRLNDDATTAAEAKRKFDMLAERLKGGADFAQLARDYSEDPQSAPQGGDLGFIPMSALNRVPEQLRKIVLDTEPGNVSTASNNGAHTLVLVVAREQAGQRDLNSPQVKQGIHDLLKERRQQILRAAYITAHRDRADVVNYLARSVAEAKGAVPGLLSGPK